MTNLEFAVCIRYTVVVTFAVNDASVIAAGMFRVTVTVVPATINVPERGRLA